MRQRRFIQCDVFTSVPTKATACRGGRWRGALGPGHAGLRRLDQSRRDDVSAAADDREADYKLRIFTPGREMPFAGHPTLGSCAAWRHLGGKPRTAGVVRQECGVGIVDIDVSARSRRSPRRKPRSRRCRRHARRHHLGAWSFERSHRADRAACNGPVWQVLELASAADVLAVDASKLRYPEFLGVGLIGPHAPGSECQFEVRMLATSSGMSEDPITGSLNAAIAQWITALASGAARDCRPGHPDRREGRVSFAGRASGNVWIGGETRILIEGTLTL